MKSSISKLSKWLTAILLGALGFSACSDLDNDQPDMYGTPTMDFQTKGCVTDTENNPIQGLRVVLTEKYNSNKYNSNRTYKREEIRLFGTCK